MRKIDYIICGGLAVLIILQIAPPFNTVQPVNKTVYNDIVQKEREIFHRETVTTSEVKKKDSLSIEIRYLREELSKLKTGTDSAAIIRSQDVVINVQDSALKTSEKIIKLKDSTIVDLKELNLDKDVIISVKDEEITELNNAVDKKSKKLKRTRRIAIGASILAGSAIYLLTK